MDSASVCPKCGYARKEADKAPAWQCPGCGVAVEKYRALQQEDQQAVQKSMEAAASAQAAMAAAAANPVTAALLHQEHWEEVPPRLPLERRLGMALLDLLMAGAFLWCWIAPGAWRPTLVSELGLIMMMEFLVIHSAMFLVMGSGGEGGSGMKIMVGFFVMLFYIPVAGAFAWWHGGWWPVLAFAWLLSARVAAMLAGRGTEAFEAKRGRFYWGSGLGYYIAFAFLVLLLPMPRLGLDWKAQYVWAGYWTMPPQDVMAWGFLYFAAIGLTKALEKPEWIADSD